MKKMLSLVLAGAVTGAIVMSACAQTKQETPASTPEKTATISVSPKAVTPPPAGQTSGIQKSTTQKSTSSAKSGTTKADTAKSSAAAREGAKPATAAKGGAADTLEIIARIIDIPGTFPANDLYNYVYFMKYRIAKVIKGTFAEKEILVGVYNPLIPRNQIKDKMKNFVGGDVQKFELGSKQKLLLIKPISKVWNDALEDGYFDIPVEEKWYALRTDIATE